MKKQNFVNLTTVFSEAGESLCSWYPRPKLVRDSFLNLNGEWDFEVSHREDIPNKFTRKIQVPFPPEASLSGVNEVYEGDVKYFYKKEFSLPDGFLKERVILHFDAVDNIADVFINGIHIGYHEGGYDRFSFDITDYLQINNTLIVRARDLIDVGDFSLPYGKQCKKRGGMWYTTASGIWQTVWLESVAEEYIKSVKVKTDEGLVTIKVEPSNISGSVSVSTPSGEVVADLINGKTEIELNNARLWSPEDPYLYYFTVETKSDKINSYFSVRDLSVGLVDSKPRLMLNGKPYFFHGLLDQGYFPDGNLTPPTEKALEYDIISMKNLGFNMLRKHIKVEPEIFYYLCDKIGMVVFQDMVNNSDYSFFRDTALPTANFKRKNDKNTHNNDQSRRRFTYGMKSTFERLDDYSCICLWTIFNEGWGQFESTKMYNLLREWDKERFIDTASGWFYPEVSDVVSEHVYFKPYKFKRADKPVILSEFGGYSFKPEGHCFNTEKTYAYRFFKDEESYCDAVISLYEKEIIPAAKSGLCAAVYTQVSDVEDETNGLLSYDRKVLKVDAARMRKIAEKLKL